MNAPLLNSFAAFDGEAIFGMFIGFGLVVVIPLIAILTSHQRKMAELLHGKRDQDAASNRHLEARLGHMQAEIDELRMRLAEHVIQLDDHRSIEQRVSSTPPPVPQELQR